jgi:acetyltransferase-like isoleucine patch superfamily enzyme
MKKIISKTAKIKNCKLDCDVIKILDGVKLDGVYIKAKKLTINKNSHLNGCKLLTNESVNIGMNSVIKENSIINAFKGITIGDRTIIDRDVMVGGMQSQYSEFGVGSDSVIIYRSYLNTTRKIIIGDHVGIGGYCLIYTHSSWPNVLEGNPFKFADVVIENNVWIPWNVSIFPGVTIHQNAIIGGSSLVTKDVPPKVFAAGVPAKIIKKKITSRISSSKKQSLFIDILKDFHEYSNEFLNISNSFINKKDFCQIKNKNSCLIYTTDFSKKSASDVVISFNIPQSIKQENQWIELDSLTSNISDDYGKQFLSFIRRYGIRIK